MSPLHRHGNAIASLRMSLSFISAGTLDVPVFAFGMDVPHRSGLARFVPAPLALTSIPMTVGVLRRENGEVVIIDAGLSRAEIAGPLRELGLNGLSMAVRGGPGVSAVDQLKARGIEPEDVTTIVATHLHLDHIGGYRDFPRASVIAPAAEFAAARRLGVRAGYVHVKEILGSGRSRPVLLDRDPKHGFPGWLDLFGDGEVILLDAKGHTAGSVAVLLTDRASGRSVLHAGDAAYQPHEYLTGKPSFFARLTRFREDWLKQTWGHLRNFRSAFPETPILLSHDPRAFHDACAAFPR